MKKKLLSLFLAIVMIASFAACGSKDTNNKEGDASQRTKFIVGFDAEFPPYGYKDDNGEYTGFDLELAAEVCKRNDWELVKQPIDWNSKDMELNSGSISCIWSGFTMNGREDDYTFTEAYIDNSIVVVVKADSDIKALKDLAGKVVIVQTDSSGLAALTGEDATAENIALAESFADLQQIADYNSAFMNLDAGAADAVVLDIGVAKYQLANNGNKFVMLDEVVSSEKYGVGFKLGNTELRDQVQKTLYEMLDDGTLAEIAERYSDYNLPEMICLGDKQ